MARGGINKALVKQAREDLLTKGQNPSIDTVRVQLGNTGSKTTIHRYLRELEEEASTRLDDEALLSSILQEMVARLASRLNEEAQAIVEKSEIRHANQQSEWQKRYEIQKQALLEAESCTADLEKQLTDSLQQQSITADQLRETTINAQRLEQQTVDIEALIEEKDKHIQSLEEKHTHSRETLEHYRQSVKEQREQDQRRHEQQVQQLQAEQRQQNQLLSVKQSDITLLNKDNAQLVTEVREARKQLLSVETRQQALTGELKSADEKATVLAMQLSEQQKFSEKQAESLTAQEAQLADTKGTMLSQTVELASLRSELEIKNQIFSKLGVDS